MYRIIGDDRREYGPVSAAQVRDWIAQGRANGQTQIKPEGASDWRPLGSLPEFYADLNPVPSQPTILLTAGESSPGPTGPAVPAPASSPYPPPPPPVPKTNNFALAGLIVAILSLPTGWCCCGPLFAVTGLVLSIVGLTQINGDAARYSGKGLAIAGIIVSIFGVILYFAIMVMFGLMTFMGEAMRFSL